MAESNATQVILTDDGIKIIKAQNTADNAASGITNLNDPNLMSVIEKQNNISQFAGLTSQYNVLIQNAKDDGIDTTAVTTAYNNLNQFMASVLADPDHTSDVDRAAYKKYQDAYNEELVKLQNALQNNANNKFTSAASATSQAASTASQAFSQASSAIGVANGATAEITKLSGDINLRVTKKGLIDEINLQAGNTLISSSGQLTLSGKNIYFDTVNPVIIPNANIDKLLVDKELKAANISANTFTTNNGTFTVDKNGSVVASNLTIRGVTNLVYNAALLGSGWNSAPGWSLTNNGYCALNVTHDGVKSIGFSNTTGAGVWNLFAQTKLHPLNGVTGQPFSASVWFLEFGSDTSLQYSFALAFFDSNGNRIESALFGQTWNGIGSRQDWRYVTINNAVAPSNAVSVGLQYWSYNGHGNACFSSPMLTQTAQATGYQPDTGNVVSAGEIDGSVINGSTINGTTFNAGDIISSTYNTSRFYPTTITPAGLVATTGFNNMDGLRTEMSAGSFVTKYRAVHSSSNQYEAYDGVFSGDELALNSGFTNGIDMGFQQSVSGNQLTGQVVLSPLNGIHLWGSTQSIHFSGLQMNGTGITFNSYGNIIADPASTWWRIVDFSGNGIANFGTDTAGSNAIQFNRELDVGNFQINTGHTFTSADGDGIHFAKGRGGAVDIYAGDVHYNSLVKSSLLSVKKDVKKADTAYWAQLVNSIDLATYQYKTDDNTSHLRLSSIVDDVNVTKQWQLPDVFISRDENGRLNGVDDSVLLNATLATVQEQQKEIDQLNGHLLELEAKLNG
ncbi:phage tail protein [Lactiplantibacillus plantarum]|uniref:phage tail protein n=1 Tax=Lactiplantibacillus plantarum TaxID=1590 RepID=UPI003A87E56B